MATSAIGETEQKSLVKHWAPAVVLMMCVVLAFFDKISIAVLFSDENFRISMGMVDDKTKAGWLMTSFLLAYGFSSIFLSFIGDIFNPKRVLFWSIVSWAILMFIMGVTTTYKFMFINRVLLGIAEGPLFALCYSIVKQRFSEKELARATTMFILGTPIGASLGFPITAYVLQYYDWHTTFHVMGFLTLIMAFFVIVGLRDVKIDRPKGVQRKKVDHKANFKSLASSYGFWIVCLFNVASMTYLWGLNSWIPTYLIEEKGFNLKSFGTLSMIPFLSMLVGEIIGAFSSDKLFHQVRARQVFIGLFGAGVAMYAMTTAQQIWLVVVTMSISSFAWGIAVAAIFPLLGQVSSKELATTAGGIFNGLGNFGSALAPVLIGVIVAASGSFNNGIYFLAIVAVVGALPLISLFKRA